MKSINAPPPHNLLRLIFETYEESCAYRLANAKMLQQLWLWQEAVGDREKPFQLDGVCDICECQTTYIATPVRMQDKPQRKFRVPWWASTQCTCKLPNRERAVLRVLFDGEFQGKRIYHVGYYSRFRRWLSERIPNITASQYQEGRRAGEIDQGIRYEDLTNLSFSDNSFDYVICMEVLEHIPNYRAALCEMARILRPGGQALLTFPWRGRDHYDHLIRAEQQRDGTIIHFQPPEYHGDPASPDGILAFRSFGWKILDELRESGFAHARAQFVFGPLHGDMTMVDPVIVGVR
jgi:SAM-dependent methyltransferase